MKPDFTYGSVCSGTHCEALAFDDVLGWRCAFIAENNPYPASVARYHRPGTPNIGDFRQLIDHAPDYATGIDLLIGGTPCQAFSVAGLRGGLNDDRGNLTLAFIRLLDALRPQWFVWENVPGVLSMDGGATFESIIRLMVECGYGVAWRVLNAERFGVAQRRRVFVVGYLGDFRRAGAVLFEPESLCGDFKKGGKKRPDVASAPTKGFGGGGPDDNRAQANHIVTRTLNTSVGRGTGGAHETSFLVYGGNDTRGARRVAAALTANGSHRDDFESENFAVQAYQCHGTDIGNMGTLKGRGCAQSGAPFVVGSRDTAQSLTESMARQPDNSDTNLGPTLAIHTFQNTGRGWFNESDVGGTQRTPDGGSSRHTNLVVNGRQDRVIAFTERGREGGRQLEYQEELAYALTSPGDGGRTQNRQLLDQYARPRRLTPKEWERLQGYPDDFTRYGRDEQGTIATISDTQRYKMIGNGFALPVVAWIARRIERIRPTPALDGRGRHGGRHTRV